MKDIFGETSMFQGTVIQARALMTTAAMADIRADDLKTEFVVKIFVATQAIFDQLADGEISQEVMTVVAQGLRVAEGLGLDLPEEMPEHVDALVPVARTAIYRKGGSKRQRNERREKMLELTGFADEVVQAGRCTGKTPRKAEDAFWNERCATIFTHLRALEEAQDWRRDTMPLPLPRNFGRSVA